MAKIFPLACLLLLALVACSATGASDLTETVENKIVNDLSDAVGDDVEFVFETVVTLVVEVVDADNENESRVSSSPNSDVSSAATLTPNEELEADPTETATPLPTSTSVPVPTSVSPTATPVTSQEKLSAASPTPVPTAIPTATATPIPTVSPPQTATPTPMPTATPTGLTNEEKVACLLTSMKEAQERIRQKIMQGGEPLEISSKPKNFEGEDECGVRSDSGETPPLFVTHNHVDTGVITQLSKFRSHAGHDYSDSYEDCSSMKHYFYFVNGQSKTEYAVYSPVTGTVLTIMNDGLGGDTTAGSVIWISPDGYPSYYVKVFHTEPIAGLDAGSTVTAGDVIGNAIGKNETNDVAIHQYTHEGERYVSVFDVMSDAAFEPWKRRGVNSRESLAITADYRKAYPLACNGDFFVERTTDFSDTTTWVMLNPA